jgi:hypothetical protein
MDKRLAWVLLPDWLDALALGEAQAGRQQCREIAFLCEEGGRIEKQRGSSAPTPKGNCTIIATRVPAGRRDSSSHCKRQR